MTPPEEAVEREAFEAHVMLLPNFVAPNIERHGDGYARTWVHHYWAGWKARAATCATQVAAAREKAVEGERKRCAEICTEIASDVTSGDDGDHPEVVAYARGCDTCALAILAPPMSSPAEPAGKGGA